MCETLHLSIAHKIQHEAEQEMISPEYEASESINFHALHRLHCRTAGLIHALSTTQGQRMYASQRRSLSFVAVSVGPHHTV